MKNRLLILAFSLLLPASVFAQDEVALGNGSLVKGKVLRNDRDSVIVQCPDGNVYGYKAIEVRKVSIGAPIVVPETPSRKEYVDFSSQQNGWWCAVELNNGALFFPDTERMGDAPVTALSELAFINGYRFSEFIKIGVGVAARFMYPNPELAVVVPVYFDVRGNIISQYSRNFAPYWQFDLGYSFDTGDGYYSGIYLSPTLGMRFGGWRHNFLVGISYMGQTIRGVGGVSGNSRFANAVCLRLSYEF